VLLLVLLMLPLPLVTHTLETDCPNNPTQSSIHYFNPVDQQFVEWLTRWTSFRLLFSPLAVSDYDHWRSYKGPCGQLRSQVGSTTSTLGRWGAAATILPESPPPARH